MRLQKLFIWLALFALLLGTVPGATAAPSPPGRAAAIQGPVPNPLSVELASTSQDDVLFFSDFEGQNGGLTGTHDWQWGTYLWDGLGCYDASNVPPPAAYSGTGMWGTVLNTCYSDLGNNTGFDTCINADPAGDSILSLTADLTDVVREAELSWWEWYDLYMPWDWAEVRANGDVVFQHCGGDYVAPTGWVQQSVDLTPYIGGPVVIEFHMMASTVVNHAGWYIDDVLLTGLQFSIDASKEAPATAEFGDVISYTVTLSASNLLTGTFMTDPLPPGVEYADNLTWTMGTAWYSATANTVFWEYTGEPSATLAVYPSQTGPEASRSVLEDGGTTLLRSAPAGVTGPRTQQGYAWTVLSAPPTGTSRSAGAVDAAGNLYVIGGESAGTRIGDVQRYDPNTGTWDNTPAPMPVPASNLCAAVIGDDIYIPGGWTGAESLTHLQVYHIGTDTWETVASDPLPAARSRIACTTHGDKLYVFGGYNDGTYYNTAWVYDPAAPAGSRWTSLANAPRAGAFGASLAVGDLIFYAGLYDGTDLPDVYAYDPIAGTWITYPSLTTPRGAAGMWAIDDLLLVGAGGWSSYLTSIEQYDTTQGTAGTWSPFEASLVQGRRTFAYTTDPIHGRLFAANGWAGGYLAEAEELAFEGVQIQITFDVTVTAHCGDMIVNEGIAGLDTIVDTFSTTTAVVGQPEIAVAPSTLEATVCAGAAITNTLSICNEGDCPLEWMIYEVAPAGPLAGSMPFVPVDVAGSGPATASLSVSSPAVTALAEPAAPPHPEAVLWDQPLSVVSQTTYVDQEFPDFPTYSSFLADDFANEAPWLVNSIFVPGGGWAGFTSLMDASALTWQIYADDGTGFPDGDPAGGGNPPVWTLTLPPNDPHVTITPGSDGLPSDTTLTPPVPVVLPPGEWWLLFYPTGTIPTLGQYGRQPADTTNGATGKFINPGGAFGYGTAWIDWTALGASQHDIAFRLEGVALPEAGDVPWLNASPITGTLAGGTCHDVDVTFDSAGLAAGSYSGDLLILSNDLSTPSMTVPVTLTVTEPVSGAAFTWSPPIPLVGDAVAFTATVAAGTPPFTYTWDLGDGATAGGVTVTHVYTAPGPYEVELVVENECGISIANATLAVYAFSLDARKSAPATARFGDVISYTITLTPSVLLPGTFMTDPLPPGVEYADNLTWSSGHAWYSDTVDTVFWHHGPAALRTPATPAVEPAAYASQVGPDASRSTQEDGGSIILESPPAGATGARAPDQVTWVVLPPPPTAASRPAGAVDAAGNFYIIGGESTAGARYGQVQRYDPGTGTWDNTLATMPTPASNLCAAVIGDDIYVPGGWTGSVALTHLQVYHTGSDSWEVIVSDPLPAGRLGPACTAFDGKLYVFGGDTGIGGGTNTAWVYDPAGAAASRWTILANVPQNGVYGAALWVNGLIFYGGASDNTFGDYAWVYGYDPAADTWTAYPNLGTARGGAGMWAIGDTLLIGGGGWSSYLTSVEQYDTALGTGGSWTPFEASLVQGRRTFAYATDADGGLLFAGGGWAGGYLAEAETLALPIEISFEVTVTGHCGDLIVNEATAGYGDVVETFTATTTVTGEATIDVSPSALEAVLCPDATAVDMLSICNTGDCTLEWTTAATVPWLGQSPISGTLPGGQCQDVDVTFDATGLAPGDYTDDLVILSNDLSTPSMTVPVTLTVTEPISGAAFSWSPPLPLVGDTVSFTATVAGGTPPLTYTWDLGDGSAATGANVTHVYTAEGTYQVQLSVENACGVSIVTGTLTVTEFSLSGRKDAPPTAQPGEVISYTITLTLSHLVTGTFMTDPLPAGVEYANNLTWTLGTAWYSETVNTVFWEVAGEMAGARTASASQIGPDVSRSVMEDAGTAILHSTPAGVTGPHSEMGYAWTVLPAPPTATSRSAGAVDAAGNFYIVAGESSGARTGEVQRYDPAAGTWDNTLATMPVPAANLCAGTIDGYIYVPGGYDGTYRSLLRRYDIAGDTWQTITSDPLPATRSASACAVYEGKLYVFGGYNGTYHSTAWVYDPAAAAGSRWTTLASVPHAAAYGAALAVGDLIFYAGLYDGTDLPDVYAYDPAANAWITYPTLTTARGAAGMWAIGDRLLVGAGGWSSYLTSVEQYDTTQGTTGTWLPFDAGLVQGRRTFAYATDPVHGRLFAGNGWAGGYLAEAEALAFQAGPTLIQITFDITITAQCGHVVNTAVAGLGTTLETFSATTTLVDGSGTILRCAYYLPLVFKAYD